MKDQLSALLTQLLDVRGYSEADDNKLAIMVHDLQVLIADTPDNVEPAPVDATTIDARLSRIESLLSKLAIATEDPQPAQGA